MGDLRWKVPLPMVPVHIEWAELDADATEAKQDELCDAADVAEHAVAVAREERVRLLQELQAVDKQIRDADALVARLRGYVYSGAGMARRHKGLIDEAGARLTDLFLLAHGVRFQAQTRFGMHGAVTYVITSLTEKQARIRAVRVDDQSLGAEERVDAATGRNSTIRTNVAEWTRVLAAYKQEEAAVKARGPALVKGGRLIPLGGGCGGVLVQPERPGGSTKEVL